MQYLKKISFVIVFCLLVSIAFAQGLQVVHLSCGNRQNPLGVETVAPKFSWQLQSAQRGVIQTAYHILVADNIIDLTNNKGTLWDSQKTISDASIQVPYCGKALMPAATYYWKVQVWDNKGRTSGWSKIASWQMGLLSATDWKGAQWIGYAAMPDSLRIVPAEQNRGPKTLSPLNDVLPLMRKTFAVQKPVKKATIFLCGLGHFELSMNGKKVSDHFLDPGWTQYDKEALYVPFDVTSQLQQGKNAVGVQLGNGFYFIPRDKRYRKLTGAFGFPKMIFRLLIEYKDGSAENIISNESWKTTESAVKFSSIYGGEDYDANSEQKGWSTATFNDHEWKQAIIIDGTPALHAQAIEPIRIMQTFIPNKPIKISDSVWVYDLRQNASGIPQISVRGKKGDTVRIVPAELLNADGTANQKATGSPYYFQYILKGDGIETWHPQFTYYGFRYLQVEKAVPASTANPNNLPVLLSVKGLHMRNSAASVGNFYCSNQLFNETDTLIDWSIKSNFMSVLTDCPHREKLGWLEQVHLMGASLRYTYDIESLFKKTISDMMTAQTPEGLVPEIAPEYVHFDYGGDMFRDSPEWGSSAVIVPWYLYQWYGDKDMLRESYSMMQRYVAYLQTKAKDGILSQGLGDWYDLGPNKPGVSQLTPMGITGTAVYYYDLNIMSQVAALLNKRDDMAKYNALAADVKVAFNKKFFNPQTKQYGTGSQTANAMAVYMNLVAPEDKDAVVANIVADIQSRNNSLTAGDVGYRYLLKVLEQEGRSDIIYAMNNRTDVPGYGYQLAKGATSLTESWQALPSVSNNHLMLGHLMEWFYAGLAGISEDSSAVAFKKIIIQPQPVGDVTWAKASCQSPYGIISSDWKKTATYFTLRVQIPANTTANVYLPATSINSISEGNKLLSAHADIKVVAQHAGTVLLSIGSGSYTFVVSNPSNQLTRK